MSKEKIAWMSKEKIAWMSKEKIAHGGFAMKMGDGNQEENGRKQEWWEMGMAGKRIGEKWDWREWGLARMGIGRKRDGRKWGDGGKMDWTEKGNVSSRTPKVARRLLAVLLFSD